MQEISLCSQAQKLSKFDWHLQNLESQIKGTQLTSNRDKTKTSLFLVCFYTHFHSFLSNTTIYLLRLQEKTAVAATGL